MTWTTGIPRQTRGLSAVLALALAVTGVGLADAATAPAAEAAAPATFNPFAIGGGFTVYARENGLLKNQETEGSIAVGDTATVQGSSGTYSIIHVAAGTGDYTLPTVDGDPTRFLTGAYDTASTGILAITSAGTSDPTLFGDLKLVDRESPFEPFARADWVRLNTNPSNVDQTPLIDATHQQYPASTIAPAGGSGGGSIYTADTSPTAVADYVEANAEASWADAAACLADLPTTAAEVTVDTSASAPPDRVVLNPLSADQVNVLDYSTLPASTRLLQFSPGPTPGVANPLVIQVPAGTTTVNGLTIDPQGQYSPYLFWDLSALTGSVDVVAPSGGSSRMDGSVYAPEADVTVTAAPLDGQVIGRNVTIAGGEVHSYLFAGTIACGDVAEPGTFQMQKALDGIGADELPAGTVFTVDYVATLPDGSVEENSLDLPADGEVVPAGLDFPAGTVVSFTELDPPTVPGWDWGTATISPASITIASPPTPTPTVTVTNTATEQTGTVSVRKAVVDGDGEPVPGATGTITADWDASDGQSGTVSFPVDGTPVALTDAEGDPAQLPVGTTVTFSNEDLSQATVPPGYDWSGAGWDPSDTITIDDTTDDVVTLSNLVAPEGTARIIGVAKTVGSDAETGFDYSVTYSTDVDPTPVVRDLRIGIPIVLDVDPAATTLTIAESVPTVDGVAVDPSQWAEPTITIGGQSSQVPFGTPITVDPLPASGIIGIGIDNALLQGTFTLQKAFSNTVFDPDRGRSTFGFMVGWTATTPDGEVTTGTVRIPANGAPVSPTDAAGDALTFPYGTTITYAELSQPNIPGVEWGTPAYSPTSLTIGDDGNAIVAATVTNTASWRTGTFLVRKQLVGIDPALLGADASFTVDYTGRTLLGETVSGSFTLPADGTPAGPAIDYPVGTVLLLSEATPDPAALPPGFAWAGTSWSPSSYVVIRDRVTPTELVVTNSVEQLTRYTVTKTVDGAGAGAVPADTVYPLNWWLNYSPQPAVPLTANETVTSPYFPVGSIVEVQEGALPTIAGVDWGTPTWTANGVQVSPEPNGRVVLPAASVGSTGTVAIVLANHADTTPLPNTGGTWSPAVTYTGMGALLLGLALLLRRRPRRTAGGRARA